MSHSPHYLIQGESLREQINIQHLLCTAAMTNSLMQWVVCMCEIERANCGWYSEREEDNLLNWCVGACCLNLPHVFTWMRVTVEPISYMNPNWEQKRDAERLDQSRSSFFDSKGKPPKCLPWEQWVRALLTEYQHRYTPLPDFLFH